MKWFFKSLMDGIDRLGSLLFGGNVKTTESTASQGERKLSISDRMLVSQYNKLQKALEREKDPMRKDMLIDDVVEIEMALRDRGIRIDELW